MEFEKFTATIDDDTRRIDRVVKKLFPTMPISFVYKNIRSGFIRINGAKAKIDTRINCNDELWVSAVLCSQYKLAGFAAQSLKKKEAFAKESIDASAKSAFANKLNTEEASEEAMKIPPVSFTYIEQTATHEKKAPNIPKNDFSPNAARDSLQTVFYNEHIMFINKPYGIRVQGATKNARDSLDAIVRARYESTPHTASLSFSPGPLHRLDRNTTGLIAFSQSLRGATWFSRAIKEKCIIKTYVGIVCGALGAESTWIDYIEDDTNARRTSHGTARCESRGAARDGFYTVRASACQASASNSGTCRASTSRASAPFEGSANGNGKSGAKKAVTHVTPLSHGFYKEKPVTLCRFVIETGRKHQIRFQSAHHGFALVGDRAYLSPLHIDASFKREYFLHAWSLDVTNATKKENPLCLPPVLYAPPDETFYRFCAVCGLSVKCIEDVTPRTV